MEALERYDCISSAEGMLTNRYGIRGEGEGWLDFPLLLNVGKEK